MSPEPASNSDGSGYLRIRTLGELSLSWYANGVDVGTLGPGKPLALVVYLAASPRLRATREQLTDLLWSDLEPDAARHALRQTAWYVKRRMGVTVIASEGESLTLVAPFEFDRDRFRDAVQQQDWPAANAIYTGDFFASFAVPGGAEFDRWAEGERERLRSNRLRVLEALVAQHLASARPRDAITVARRLRDAEPLRQASWRLVLEAHMAARDPLGARLEADALEAVLARDVVEAEPATRRLLKLVTNARPAAGEAPSGLTTELVGREREFAAALWAWESSRDGVPRAVSVSGVAGIGKSRLLADLAARMGAARARVLAVRASSSSTDVPYALAADLVAALSECPGSAAVNGRVAGTLLALNPALSSVFAHAHADPSVGDEALRRRIVAVRDLLSAVSDEQAIVLIVDDLHWADLSSRRLLAASLTGLERGRLLIMAASRQSLTDVLPGVERGTGLWEELQLAPLDREQVARLVSSVAMLADVEGDTLVDGLVRATGGLPLLVLETLQLACEQQILSVESGSWRVLHPDGLGRLLVSGAALSRRLDALAPAELAVLLACAVAQSPLKRQAIEHVTGANGELPGRLSAIEERGLLVREGDAWRVVHDEYAALLRARASREQLRVLHMRVGESLLADGADSRREREAALHFVAAGDVLPLAPVLSERVERARRNRRMVSSAALARELVGADVPDRDVRALVQRVPLLTRIGVVSWERAAVAMIALIAITGWLAGWGNSKPVGADRPALPRLAVLVPGSAPREVAVYDVKLEDVIGSEKPVGLPRTPVARVHDMQTMEFSASAVSPSGWIYSRTTRDSGKMDLFELAPGRVERRLTHAVGDDFDASPSPDDRRLLFSTARFDTTLDHSDVALLDRASGKTTRLTFTDAIDNGGRWSPDGSRIAFLSRPLDRPGRLLCVMDADGTHQRCETNNVDRLLGWLNGSTVVVTAGSDAQTPGHLGYANADSLTVRDSDVQANGASLSPDGRWILCRCLIAGYPPDGTWWVMSSTDLGTRHLVRVATPQGMTPQFLWMPPNTRIGFLDRLFVQAPPRIAKGQRFALDAMGADIRGASVVPGVVRWASSDSALAVVREDGVLEARQPGVLRVLASAGGWRGAEKVVTIGAQEPLRVLMQEPWSEGWEREWFSWGEPRSFVQSIDGGRWIVPNGDGRYQSGVLSREGWTAENGLTVEAMVRMPITRTQWQSITIALIAVKDPARDSHLFTEHDPGPPEQAEVYCNFGYPTDPEGWGYGEHGVVGARSQVATNTLFTAPPQLREGKPTSVVLSLMPDRRCAMQVNGGEPKYTRPAARLDLNLRYHVLVGSQSKWTTAAIGPIRVSSGVGVGASAERGNKATAAR